MSHEFQCPKLRELKDISKRKKELYEENRQLKHELQCAQYELARLKGQIETMTRVTYMVGAVSPKPEPPVVWVRKSRLKCFYRVKVDGSFFTHDPQLVAYNLNQWRECIGDLATVRVWEEPAPEPEDHCPKCGQRVPK